MNRKNSHRIIWLLILTGLIFTCEADFFAEQSRFEVCFTPQQNCTQKIIERIQAAKQEILIQMYVFTNWRLAKALVAAQKRGVKVKIILDENGFKFKSELLKFLLRNRLVVKIDHSSGLAHNKIMIIDRKITIGGSFNYTNRAQLANKENVTVIEDVGYTKNFVRNWQRCFQEATFYRENK